MKVTWVGGPLDGAADRSENMPMLQTLWYGPDISEPLTKVIVYELHTQGEDREYRYSQELTELANQRLAEQRGLPLEGTPTDDESTPGGHDGTGDDREGAGEDRQPGRSTGE